MDIKGYIIINIIIFIFFDNNELFYLFQWF